MFKGEGVFVGVRDLQSKSGNSFKMISVGDPVKFTRVEFIINEDCVMPNDLVPGKSRIEVMVDLEMRNYRLSGSVTNIKKVV